MSVKLHYKINTLLKCTAMPSSQVSPTVSCKPPMLPVGVNAMWAWFWATLTVSDSELLASCGLDALMFVKMYTLGKPSLHLS